MKRTIISMFFVVVIISMFAVAVVLPKDSRREDNKRTNNQGWKFVSPMPTARIGPAVVAGDDHAIIYVMGGSTENSVQTVTGANEAYSTEDDSWVSLAPMPTPRRFAMAAVDLSGRIYVIGGGSPKFTPTFTNIVERYLPDKDIWEELPQMPTNRVNAAVTTGLDGLIYVMGGFNGNQTTAVEVFDPNSNTWSQLAPLLVASAGGLGGATGPDGTIYAIGGITGGLVNTTELDLVQAYDPSSRSWSLKTPMPTARHGVASTTGQNDLVYIVGGTTGEGGGVPAADGVLDVVESYNPLTDVWATAPSLLTARAGHGAGTSEDGTICAFGGVDGSNNILNSVECLRPRGHYTVTDVGTLGGTSSVGCGLNSRGEVVGKSSIVTGEAHAFLWNRNEGITDLGTLPGLFFSEARDINNRGQVVGDSTRTGGPPFRAVLWDGDAMTDLGTLGGPAAFAIAINKDAQVVGGARAANGELHGFLWQDSVMTDLGTLPGDTFSVARAINNRGQVAATSAPVQPTPAGDCPTAPLGPDPQRAFLLSDGGITDLGTLGGAIAVPKGINNRGEIVGISSTFAAEAHAFLWSDGAMHDLGTLGGTFSIANGINNHGQAVGLSGIASGELHAFLWEDRVMTDLNNLIPAGSGWILVEATAINKAGQIAGVGTINGQTHAFLLTPDDEDD